MTQFNIKPMPKLKLYYPNDPSYYQDLSDHLQSICEAQAEVLKLYHNASDGGCIPMSQWRRERAEQLLAADIAHDELEQAIKVARGEA